jgi:hypothetical protein
MWVVAGVLIAAVLFGGTNVVLTARRASKFPEYWSDRMDEPVPTNAIRLVALGDSSVQAIGADEPMMLRLFCVLLTLPAA